MKPPIQLNVNKENIFIFGLLFFLLLSGCAQKNENKIIQLKSILEKANQLDTEGNLKEAYKLYSILENFKDNNEFKTLNIPEILAKRGWSIGALKDSYALKQLTSLQNEINEYFKKNNKYPELNELKNGITDPWERPIIYKIIPQHLVKTYDYYLHSLGNDGINDSSDDIKILNKAINIIKKEKIKKTEEQQKMTNEKLLSIEEILAGKKRRE